MKKALLLLSVVGLISFTSCKNEKAAEAETKETTTQVENSEEAPKTEETSTEITFSDKDVEQYANDYKAFAKSFIEAYKSKDQAKIAELSKNAQEWATKGTEMAKKLESNPEDAKKFSELAMTLGKEMQEAMMAK